MEVRMPAGKSDSMFSNLAIQCHRENPSNVFFRAHFVERWLTFLRLLLNDSAARRLASRRRWKQGQICSNAEWVIDERGSRGCGRWLLTSSVVSTIFSTEEK